MVNGTLVYYSIYYHNHTGHYTILIACLLLWAATDPECDLW